MGASVLGDTLLRVLGKALLHKQAEFLTSLLTPAQVGVGVPNACELISHIVRVCPSGSLLHLLSHVPLSDGLTVLDAYVGPPHSHFEEYCVKLNEGSAHVLERLCALECPQTASLLLRSCLGACKLTYAARAIPFDLLQPTLQACPHLVWDALSQCLGSPLTPSQ